jgi:hypothetical protein
MSNFNSPGRANERVELRVSRYPSVTGPRAARHELRSSAASDVALQGYALRPAGFAGRSQPPSPSQEAASRSQDSVCVRDGSISRLIRGQFGVLGQLER